MRRRSSYAAIAAMFFAVITLIYYLLPDASLADRNPGTLSGSTAVDRQVAVDHSLQNDEKGGKTSSSGKKPLATSAVQQPYRNLRELLPESQIVQQRTSPYSPEAVERSVLVKVPGARHQLVRIDEVVSTDSKGREILWAQTVYSASHVIIKTVRPPGGAIKIGNGIYKLPLQARDLDSFDRELADIRSEASNSLVELDFMIFGASQNAPLWSLEKASDTLFSANPPAVAYRSGLPPVTVAVLDSGVNLQHPSIASAIFKNAAEIPGNGLDDDGNGYVDDILGWDMRQMDAVPQDGEGHGTLIASVIAGRPSSVLPVGGLFPSGHLIPVRVLDDHGAGYVSDAIAGFSYAESRGAKVVNVSWGTTQQSELLRERVANYPGSIVAAAGNSRANLDQSPLYPAAYNLPNVVTVAASDAQGRLSSYSSYGPYRVHLAAPGDDISGAGLTLETATRSGTSMAVPHVTAALAMGYALAAEAEPEELRNLLVLSTRSSDALADKVQSGGVLDIARFLRAVSAEYVGQLGETNVLYDISFEAPTHSLGQLSTLGAPLSPSAIVAGAPTVADSSRTGSRSLVFADSAQETIELGISGASPAFRYEMELASPFDGSGSQAALFSIQLRGQSQRSIKISGNGVMSLSLNGGKTVELGKLEANTVHRLSFEIVTGQDSLKIYLNGALRHDGQLGYLGNLNAIRLAYSGGAETPGIEVDNILLVKDFESLPADPTRIVADPGVLDLGAVEIHQPVDGTLTLRNVSRHAVEVSGVISTIPEVDIEWAGSLDAYSSVEIPYTVLADELGPLNGFVEITSDDPVNPVLPIRILGSIESPPIIRVEPGVIRETLGPTGISNIPLTISNDGNVALNWTLEAISTSGNEEEIYEEGAYDFRTSRTDESLPFNWSDLAQPDGSSISISSNQPVTVTLPFDFPFYGQNRRELRISPYGYLTFGTSATTFNNTSIPRSNNPNALIAAFWDRLDVSKGTVHTRYDQSLGRFGVQFTGVGTYFGHEDSLTFQIFLYDTGRIVFNYLEVDVANPSYTVGIENDTGTSGMLLAYNETFVEDRLAIEIYPTGDWLSVSPFTGSTLPGSSSTVEVDLTGNILSSGSYLGRIKITSNDREHPELVIPVELTIGGTPSIELQSGVLALDDRMPGDTVTETFTIYNPGDSAIEVTSIISSNEVFSVDLADGFLLGAKQAQDIRVSFMPDGLGEFQGELSLFAGESAEAAIIVPMTGRGVTPPQLTVSDLPLLTVPLPSGSSGYLEMTLTNSGGFPADWTSAHSGPPGTILNTRSASGSLTAFTLVGDDYWVVNESVLQRQDETGQVLQTISAGLIPATTDIVHRAGLLYVSNFLDGTIRVFKAEDGTEKTPLILAANGIRALEILRDTVYVLEEKTARLKSYDRYTGQLLNTSSSSFTTHTGLVFDGFRLRSYNRSTKALDSLTDSATAIEAKDLQVQNIISGLALDGDNYKLLDRDRQFIEISSGKPDTVNWIEVRPLSGRVAPGSNSAPIQIHLSAYDLYAGTYPAEVRITGPYIPDLIVPVILEVSGEPEMSLFESSLDLASVVTGTTQSGIVTFRNTGTAPLVLETIQLPPGVNFVNLPALPLTLPAEADLELHVSFTAGEIGAGVLSIGFNGGANVNGVDIPVVVQDVPDIALTPDPLSVSVIAGQVAESSILIENTGEGPLAINNMQATLEVSGELVNIPLPQTSLLLAPDEQETLEVDISAATLGAGSYTGEIRLWTNIPGREEVSLPINFEVELAPVDVGYTNIRLPIIGGVPETRMELNTVSSPEFGTDWLVTSDIAELTVTRDGSKVLLVATQAGLSGELTFDNGNESFTVPVKTEAESLNLVSLLRGANEDELMALHGPPSSSLPASLVLYSESTGAPLRAIVLSPDVTDVTLDHAGDYIYTVSKAEKKITRYHADTVSLADTREFSLSNYQSSGNAFNIVAYDAERIAFVDDSTKPRLHHYNYTTGTLIEQETVSGTGGIVFSNDGQYIYAWSQGNWNPGTYYSTAYKYEFGKTTPSAASANGLFYRNPLNSPIFISDDGDVIVKTHRLSGQNLATEAQFSGNIVAASKDGLFGATSNRLVNAINGEDILPLAQVSDLRVFSRNNDALLTVVAGQSTLHRYPLNPPTILVAEPSIDAGDLFLEEVSTLTIPVYNDGVLPLIISDVSVSVGSISLLDELPVSIPAKMTYNLQLALAPEQTGLLESEITLTSNDVETPQTVVEVSANIVRGPNANVSAPVLDLLAYAGDVLVETISLSNTGSAPLEWSLKNSDALPYWLEVSPQSGVINAGDSAEITVRVDVGSLTPQNYTHHLVFSTNSPLTSEISVEVSLDVLSGGGLYTSRRDGMDFGEVFVGGEIDNFFQLENVGDEPVDLISITVEGGAGFILSGAPLNQLFPGESENIRVIFAPDAIGLRTANLVIHSTDPSDPVITIPLTGVGIEAPKLEISTTSITAETTVFQSVARKLTLTNGGGSTLEALVYTDATLPIFEVSQNDLSIPAGNSVELTVTMGSETLLGGQYDGALLIESNDPLSRSASVSLSLVVNGDPELVPLDASYRFENSIVNTSRTAGFVIENIGTGPLTLTNINLTGSAFILEEAVEGLVVPPQESRTLRVRFTPHEVGVFNGALAFETDDTASPQVSISLMGEGVQSPSIIVTPRSLSTTLNAGDKGTSSFTISNDGDAEIPLNYFLTVARGSNYNLNLMSADLPVASSYDPYRKLEKSRDEGLMAFGSGNLTLSSGNIYLMNPAVGGISEVDPLTDIYASNLPSPENVSGGPDGLAFDGIYFYVVNGFGTNQIHQIEARSGSVIRSVTIPGLQFDGLAHDGTSLYALDYSRSAIVEVDMENASIIRTVYETSGLGGGLTAGGTRGSLFVSRFGSAIYEVSTTDGSLIQSFTPPVSVYGMAYSQTNQRLYVSDIKTDQLVTLDPDTLEIERIATHADIGGLAADEYATGNNWFEMTPSEGTLSPGESVEVSLAMDAATLLAGNYTSTVLVKSNDVNNPVIEVDLSLNVIGAPGIKLGKDQIDFGHALVGTILADELTITNDGSDTLIVSSMTTDLDDLTIATGLPLFIAPRTSQTLQIRFVPEEVGLYDGSITVTSNDPTDGAIVLPIVAEIGSAPTIELNEERLEFVLTPGGAASRNLQLGNKGEAALSWSIDLSSRSYGGNAGGKTSGMSLPLPAAGAINAASVPDKVIVRYHDDATTGALAALEAEIFAQVVYRSPLVDGLTVLEVDTAYATMENTLEKLRNDPRVDYVEPDYILYSSELSITDTDFEALWALRNTGQLDGLPGADIDAEEAWEVSNGGSNILVAVIDSGVDYLHQDLVQNIFKNTEEIPGNGVDDDGNGYVDDVRGWNFVTGNSSPFDDNSHGTHVAGIIAASRNDIGIIGVAYESTILPIKFLSASGTGSTSDAIRSIEYAALMGAHIANCSWGGGGYSQGLHDAIAAAGDAGMLVVAAAGNSSRNIDISPNYPASYDLPNIIAVASTDPRDELSSFSNFGENTVQIAAPGSSIYSALPGDRYGIKSGTSMAAPHVAGVAALLLGNNPEINVHEIINLLQQGSERLPSLTGKVAGGYRLNARGALDALAPPWLSLDTTSGSLAAGANTNILLGVQTTMLQPGKYNASLIISTNDPKKPTEEIGVVLYMRDPEDITARYMLWVDEYFPEATSEDVWALGADPDGDGLTNLTEYFFGTNPNERNAPPVIQTLRDGEGITLVFEINADAGDVAYELQGTEDLSDWATVTPSELKTEMLSTTKLKVTARLPATSTRNHFYRIKVPLPE